MWKKRLMTEVNIKIWYSLPYKSTYAYHMSNFETISLTTRTLMDNQWKSRGNTHRFRLFNLKWILQIWKILHFIVRFTDQHTDSRNIARFVVYESMTAFRSLALFYSYLISQNKSEKLKKLVTNMILIWNQKPWKVYEF